MNKRGIISEYLPWLLIALAILVIILISIWVLKDKGFSVIEGIKNMFRFR